MDDEVHNLNRCISDLELRLLTKEPLEVFMRNDHRFATLKRIDLHAIVGEKFLSVSGNALSSTRAAPALRLAIDAYLKKCDIRIRPSYEVDNLAAERRTANDRSVPRLQERQ
jgi:LysR family hca operon transcriptional activator